MSVIFEKQITINQKSTERPNSHSRQDIAEILLKVALNTINQSNQPNSQNTPFRLEHDIFHINLFIIKIKAQIQVKGEAVGRYGSRDDNQADVEKVMLYNIYYILYQMIWKYEPFWYGLSDWVDMALWPQLDW